MANNSLFSCCYEAVVVIHDTPDARAEFMNAVIIVMGSMPRSEVRPFKVNAHPGVPSGQTLYGVRIRFCGLQTADFAATMYAPMPEICESLRAGWPTAVLSTVTTLIGNHEEARLIGYVQDQAQQFSASSVATTIANVG